MSKVYITSDWHLGHLGIQRFRPEFKDVEDHDEYLLDLYAKTVTKRDVVWFLGDVAFTAEKLRLLKDLPGRKNLVLGNHCTDRKLQMGDYTDVFSNIHGLVKFKKAWLSHAPIHPQELRGKINVHGHVHRQSIPDSKYINVCIEATDYKMKTYQELLGY